jgi:hypothetical protein
MCAVYGTLLSVSNLYCYDEEQLLLLYKCQGKYLDVKQRERIVLFKNTVSW